jgi:hypothetical protein
MSYKVVLTHSFKQSVKRPGKRFRHVKAALPYLTNERSNTE